MGFAGFGLAMLTFLTAMKRDLKADISGLRTELKSELADARTELKTDIARVETRMISLANRTYDISTRLPAAPQLPGTRHP